MFVKNENGVWEDKTPITRIVTHKTKEQPNPKLMEEFLANGGKIEYPTERVFRKLSHNIVDNEAKRVFEQMDIERMLNEYKRATGAISDIEEIYSYENKTMNKRKLRILEKRFHRCPETGLLIIPNSPIVRFKYDNAILYVLDKTKIGFLIALEEGYFFYTVEREIGENPDDQDYFEVTISVSESELVKEIKRVDNVKLTDSGVLSKTRFKTVNFLENEVYPNLYELTADKIFEVFRREDRNESNN